MDYGDLAVVSAIIITLTVITLILTSWEEILEDIKRWKTRR